MQESKVKNHNDKGIIKKELKKFLHFYLSFCILRFAF
ncbi:MAG: hypothetical protein UT66_C0018G0034 [candidate division CPR2 bacterium GW2011_GWC1_39_9]|nr:MAG: hypothetical protein UT66_C0018G0034 [candidate division CPR2 bacterium GW2011_GWC1_39_9]